MPQIISEKNTKSLKWIILGAITGVIVIGGGLWLWLGPRSAKPEPTPAPYRAAQYAAPVTSESIKAAHENVTVEATVTALTPTELTLKPTGAAKSLKLQITPSTTYAKTATYQPADGKDLRVGEIVQVRYNNASLQAQDISYGF